MAPLDRPRHNRALRAAPRTEMADLATILCIDDDRETLEVRQRVLRSAGYDVLTAQGGRAGLDVISSGARVNLVVLDYMMPGMNGDEVVEYVKAALPQIPIIAVSAVRLPPNMLRTVDAYVQKGQDVEVLLSAVAQVLAAGGPQASEGGCKRTVLCADDEINELAARKMVFESAGFKVLVARNGAQALETFRSQPVDAVVLDYFMPGMTGLSVAREMKRLRPEVPIIVLSGFASLPGETIGVVDSWLQKRDVEALVRELENLIERKASSPTASH
jgi:CheY-like chemotaxis protein